MPDVPSLPYSLLTALAAEADRSAPGARTLLVAPTRGEGREILRALARHRGGWLGLEVTTVRPLALELVGAAQAGKARLERVIEAPHATVREAGAEPAERRLPRRLVEPLVQLGPRGDAYDVGHFLR